MSGKKLFVSNSTESIRLFESDWMEALSKVHFSVPLIIFLPVIGFMFYLGFSGTSMGIGAALVWIVLGFLSWTLTEYIMHRFVFHFEPKSEWGQKLHFIFHGIHHDYPCDRLRLVLPPSVSIPLATGFFFLFRSFIPAPGLFVFFGSFLIGYLIYDMFHYAIHHLEVKGKLWNILKTHHLKHHYVDPHKGYGVSSPVWDYIAQSHFEESNNQPKEELKEVESPVEA